MAEILRVSDDEDSSAGDLTSIVEQDHAMSIRILRLANSAFYGFRVPVHSIKEAVVALGFKTVRSLALTTSVFDTLSLRRQVALDPTDFWTHSFGAARAAQFVAMSAESKASPEICFTAGLIHDIGKYVLALALKNDYRRIVQQSKEETISLSQIEFSTLGITSAEVGGWLAERWRLSAIITISITQLNDAEAYSGTNETEVVSVALGDQISRLTGFGLGGDFSPPVLSNRLAERLRFTRDNLTLLQTEMKAILDETHSLIAILKEP
jgi:HD-like signal output (HDOD) protein